MRPVVVKEPASILYNTTPSSFAKLESAKEEGVFYEQNEINRRYGHLGESRRFYKIHSLVCLKFGFSAGGNCLAGVVFRYENEAARSEAMETVPPLYSFGCTAGIRMAHPVLWLQAYQHCFGSDDLQYVPSICDDPCTAGA